MMRLPGRRGALLPMVLIVMVIIALAAVAALFAGRQDRRASWNTRLQTTALAAVDLAHAEELQRFAGVAPSLAFGGSVARRLSIADGIDATARLTRLGPTLFVLTADAGATAQGWLARRRASLILRLDPPSVEFPAALTVVGGPAPDARVADGSDRAPEQWPCATRDADSLPIRHPSQPPDSIVLAGLRARASHRLAAGAVMHGVHPIVRDGACAIDRPDNWGDPDRAGPCATWLPVIHAAGDLTIDGGVGQGVLLVDGTLVIGGGFRFVGAVIVGGAIEIGADGASLTGGVIAGSVRDASRGSGPVPFVHRSSCALDAALLAAGALVPVIDRAWASTR